MKHYEPGKPYPRKRTDSGPAVRRHSAAAYARREMRRKQIRRNRIFFGVLLVILAGLIFAAVHLTLKDNGEEGASSSQSSASSAVSSSPASQPASEPASEPTQQEPAAFVPPWDTTGEEGFPYLVAVNRVTQTVTVYEKDEEGNYTQPLKAMICSTGDDTPEGSFHTSDQYTWRALVGGVYGQYATRITSDILFHSVPYYAEDKSQLESEEYNKLGTPASLGCIRLKVVDCKWIYDECPSGTPVVIFDGDASNDPLGTPEFEPMDLESPNAGWDPTDPDPANPWLASA